MSATVTKTVKASGGDYTTLAAYEAGEQGDLVAADEIRQAECYASASETLSAATAIDGSTTDATRYMRIYTPLAERHKRTVASGYVLTAAAGLPFLLVNVSDTFCRVEGLALDLSPATATSLRGIELSEASNRLSHCVVKHMNANATGTGISVVGTPVFCWNCLVYNYREADAFRGAFAAASGGTAYFFNNTAIGVAGGTPAAPGFLAFATAIVAKNNIAYMPSRIGFATGGGGSWDAASTNNASSDATAPGSNPRNSQTFTFKNPDLQDFGLSQYDAGAKDYGVDLSADANLPFSDDINGMTRPVGSAWDIGAHEAGIISTDIFHYPSQ